MKENTDLRDRINTNIGKLLASMTQKEKAEAKRRALEKKNILKIS